MIERFQAIDIARKHAAEKGWEFLEPLHIVPHHGFFGGVITYEIDTNHGRPGARLRFVIDANNGAVISASRV